MEKINTSFKRSEYGQIIDPRPIIYNKSHVPSYLEDLFSEAECLIQTAVKAKKIQPQYDNIETEWKRGRIKDRSGDACRHEIYDISDDGRHTLLCTRMAEGSKYGIRTVSKTYFIISTHGKGSRVVEAPKSKAAKAAKQAVNPGDAIQVCLGKKKLTSPMTEKRVCFKIVAKTDDGFESVYDQSPWDLEKSRVEKSSMNHESGFYVFPTVTAAMSAWTERNAFASEWMTSEKYAILKCECSGRSYSFDNDKICISRVKPVKEIANFHG